MHEKYEFNACSMHDKRQDSCMILAKFHCMIMHDLIPWELDEPVSTSHPCANYVPFPRVYNIRVLFHYPDGVGVLGAFRTLTH